MLTKVHLILDVILGAHFGRPGGLFVVGFGLFGLLWTLWGPIWAGVVRIGAGGGSDRGRGWFG